LRIKIRGSEKFIIAVQNKEYKKDKKTYTNYMDSIKDDYIDRERIVKFKLVCYSSKIFTDWHDKNRFNKILKERNKARVAIRIVERRVKGTLEKMNKIQYIFHGDINDLDKNNCEKWKLIWINIRLSIFCK
jgi:hypothetical protein